MIGLGTPHEWIRFLEVRTAEDAVGELRRASTRLDSASDEVGYVLMQFSGAPDGDIEECLRVARSTTNEAIAGLNSAIMRIRLGDPDAA